MESKLFMLYKAMYDEGIHLYDYRLEGEKAVTIAMEQQYGVFIDTRAIETVSEETTLIAHELGHCVTGSTHSVSSPLDLIEKHEYKADKYAVHTLITADELVEAIRAGYTETWQLAEYFGVTEAFIRRTTYIYQCEGQIA